MDVKNYLIDLSVHKSDDERNVYEYLIQIEGEPRILNGISDSLRVIELRFYSDSRSDFQPRYERTLQRAYAYFPISEYNTYLEILRNSNRNLIAYYRFLPSQSLHEVLLRVSGRLPLKP